MTKHLYTIFALVFLPALRAQDVPPPPKPVEGPSLEATMKFIQDKLNEQGKVNYVTTLRNNQTNTVMQTHSMSVKLTVNNADPASCTLSFTKELNNPASLVLRWEFSLGDVEKLALAGGRSLQPEVRSGRSPRTGFRICPSFL